MLLARRRYCAWTPVIVGLIGTDLFALWIWAARPLRIYSYMLGLVGTADDAPIPRFVRWATGIKGPRTPSGFVALFESGELFFGVVFLAALSLLILILVGRRAESPVWQRLSARFSLAKAIAVRFRVRTALVAIAVLALYMGWEIHAWRTWRLRTIYEERVARAIKGKHDNQASLERLQRNFARLSEEERLTPGDDFAPEIGYYRTKAAVAAERAALKHRWEREAAQLFSLVATYDARSANMNRQSTTRGEPWNRTGLCRSGCARTQWTSGGQWATIRRPGQL